MALNRNRHIFYITNLVPGSFGKVKTVVNLDCVSRLVFFPYMQVKLNYLLCGYTKSSIGVVRLYELYFVFI